MGASIGLSVELHFITELQDIHSHIQFTVLLHCSEVEGISDLMIGGLHSLKFLIESICDVLCEGFIPIVVNRSSKSVMGQSNLLWSVNQR